MTKGYADYIETLTEEIDRDLQREIDGVDIPLFSKGFEEWLKKQKEISERSRSNYMYWISKADAWLLDPDRDFWTLLKKAWDASDFGTAKKLCIEYKNRLLKEKANAENDQYWGEKPQNIGNWICAFSKYIKFYDEMIENADIDKIAFSAMIESSRQTSEHLLLSFRFTQWGISQKISKATMTSYISLIKRVNRDLFCKTGYDLLYDFLPEYVKTKNADKIDEMFTAMHNKLTERIEYYDETEMSRDVFYKARTALSKYAKFIRSVINQTD